MGCNRIYTVYKPLEVGVLCLECTHLTSSKEESRGTWKDVVEEPEVRRGSSSREVTRSLKITRTLRPDVLIWRYTYTILQLYTVLHQLLWYTHRFRFWRESGQHYRPSPSFLVLTQRCGYFPSEFWWLCTYVLRIIFSILLCVRRLKSHLAIL